MKKFAQIMGMPVSVEIVDEVSPDIFEEAFDYFRDVDARFSTYKAASEISQINRGLPKEKWSRSMKQVMDLCEKTKQETNGYFDIDHDGKLDPSGLVKGWAINNVAMLLKKHGLKDFYVEAGGDIQPSGHNKDGEKWRVGIKNPFNRAEIIKVVEVSNEGVATSGTYIRGQHIYNPLKAGVSPEGVISITVIGPNIYDADRMATAAHAMGKSGITYIEKLDGFEAYQVATGKTATMTSNFESWVAK